MKNSYPKYVYQSEVFDIAWTHDRKGFLVLPDGTKYRYKNPKQWHEPINLEVEDARAKLHEKQSRLQFPYNDAESKMVREMYESFEETHGKNTKKQMSIEHLLANIKTAKRGWFNKGILAPFDISEKTIIELNEAQITHEEWPVCDARIVSSQLYVYDEQLNNYNMILLRSNEATNRSEHVDRLLKHFGAV